MVNFLIITGIGPTKHFFGCFPTRMGMFVLFLLQGAIIALDILEHEKLFAKGEVVNQWVTMSIQIVVAIPCCVVVFWQNKCFAVVAYFVLLAASAATVAEKIVKINAIGSIDIFKLMQGYILTLQFVYAARSAFEFFFYFYCAYIAYSYSTIIGSNAPQEEKLVSTSSK